jgi:hypothetical protein
MQVTLYVVLTVGETETDPETPVGEKPVPLQPVALVDDHESVDEAPEATLGGFAPKMISGAVGDTAESALVHPPGIVVVEGYLPPCHRLGAHWTADDRALVCLRLLAG